MREMLVFAGLFLIIAAGGCSEQSADVESSKLCQGGVGMAEMVDLCEEVLLDLTFDIDKSDVASGVVLSRPLRGGQFFEFWRRDNQGGFNNAESNIHSLRRTARFDLAESEGKVCVTCLVDVERLSLSNMGASEPGYKYDKMSSRNIRLANMQVDVSGKEKSWIDMGGDYRLESELMERLAKKVSQR